MQRQDKVLLKKLVKTYERLYNYSDETTQANFYVLFHNTMPRVLTDCVLAGTLVRIEARRFVETLTWEEQEQWLKTNHIYIRLWHPRHPFTAKVERPRRPVGI